MPQRISGIRVKDGKRTRKVHGRTTIKGLARMAEKEGKTVDFKLTPKAMTREQKLLCLQLGIENLSCAVPVLHRSRMTISHTVDEALALRIQKMHAALVSLVIDVAKAADARRAKLK